MSGPSVSPGTSVEIEPCPFCGHELYRSPRNHNPKAYCVTEDCYGKRMSVVNLDDPVIVAMWNTRAGPAATAGTVNIEGIIGDCISVEPLPWKDDDGKPAILNKIVGIHEAANQIRAALVSRPEPAATPAPPSKRMPRFPDAISPEPPENAQ